VAFGKRASPPSDAQAAAASTRRRPLTAMPTAFLRRLALIIAAVAAMNVVGYFTLRLQSQWRDAVWDNMKLQSGEMVDEFGRPAID